MKDKIRGSEKKWSLQKHRTKVNELYTWKNNQMDKQEIRAQDIEDRELEDCTFTPNLSNYSRYLMNKRGKKIKKKIKSRNKELKKKRQQKINEEKENTKDKKKTVTLDMEKADTFYKRMTAWSEKKDKLLKQKAIEKWVKENEDDTNHLSNRKKKRMNPHKQIERAIKLSKTNEIRDKKIEDIKKKQTKGLFYPKTTKHIPKVIQKEFEKRKKDQQLIEDFIKEQIQEGRFFEAEVLSKKKSGKSPRKGGSSRKKTDPRSKKDDPEDSQNTSSVMQFGNTIINLVPVNANEALSFTESVRDAGRIVEPRLSQGQDDQ